VLGPPNLLVDLLDGQVKLDDVAADEQLHALVILDQPAQVQVATDLVLLVISERIDHT
jgi:hypothetical protein